MTNKTRAQERIDDVDISPTALLADVEAARKEAADAKAKADEYLGALQRERAEFLNFKRRTTEERERDLGLAATTSSRKVLAIADDFDRAIEAHAGRARASDAWSSGIAAIDRKLRGLLESEGVRPIERLGAPFDPREHEAVVTCPARAGHDGEVVAEVQRGYRIRDRVLRPALVGVADGADRRGRRRRTTSPPNEHD